MWLLPIFFGTMREKLYKIKVHNIGPEVGEKNPLVTLTRIKGYIVRVEYISISPEEMKAKRAAIGRIIADIIRRETLK